MQLNYLQEKYQLTVKKEVSLYTIPLGSPIHASQKSTELLDAKLLETKLLKFKRDYPNITFITDKEGGWMSNCNPHLTKEESGKFEAELRKLINVTNELVKIESRIRVSDLSKKTFRVNIESSNETFKAIFKNVMQCPEYREREIVPKPKTEESCGIS